MTSKFHQKIRHAIQNQELQRALDKNAEDRAQAREEAYQTLSTSFETLRQEAHRIRTEVIDDLPNYLAAFLEKARENGFSIHKAAHAAEARGIILDICQEKKASLVVKSKSMVSEEIELNKALEAKGIEVVETDLGEYIIQLRGEHPSHIITPAVHLNRSEIGRTFQERLGIPYTEDVTTLTAAAREHLRNTFLKADIGISGVNFGIAESGSLCILTNEGNGRMVTTLPPVHIALMGCERLVPTMDDLACMLTLLPRSATGQKITVYTQILNGPKLSSDPDGPRERHLIIVDNERLSMRDSSLREALLCIRCGACINACPVFQEIGGHAYVSKNGKHTPYPGPIGSIVSPGIFGRKAFGHLAQASTLCEACYDACPVSIDLPKLLLRVRAGEVHMPTTAEGKTRPSGLNFFTKLFLRMFTWASKDKKRFRFAQKALIGWGKIASPFSDWIHMPAYSGWGVSKDLLRPADTPFRERFPALQKEVKVAIDSARKPKKADQESTLRENRQAVIAPVDRFQQELEDLGGHFIPCTFEDLPQKIAAFLVKRDTKRLFAWKAPGLPQHVLSHLKKQGIEVIHNADPALDIGLTGAQAGIAETGTLVLTAGADRPATTSLLPSIHVAVLDARDIYKTLSSALNDPRFTQTAATNLISGPSRTADIEMTLDIGVHGPKEVHVFCIMS